MSDQMEGMNEVKSSFVKWGKVGDFVRGTLLNVREIDNKMPGKEGTKTKLYEFRVAEGKFHNMDENKQPVEPEVVLVKDDIWVVGGKEGLDNQMRNIKLGQVFGMRFSEVKPAKTKGFNPAKVIKVYAGEMDPLYMGEKPGDVTFS